MLDQLFSGGDWSATNTCTGMLQGAESAAKAAVAILRWMNVFCDACPSYWRHTATATGMIWTSDGSARL
jgi:hypothetical protein